MEKITIKELVDFRRKSDKNKKKSFASKLKTRKAKEKKEDKTGGGNYWIISSSCILNVFKTDDPNYYDEKIDEVSEKLRVTEIKNTKIMYQRNIDILTAFKDFDFSDLKPTQDLKYEKVVRSSTIITIKGFPLYINPDALFSFNIKGKDKMGALWLIQQQDGFSKSELGMFCEALYRFLVNNYGNNFQISEEFCVVIDTCGAQRITYSEMLNGGSTFLIDETLEEIKTI